MNTVCTQLLRSSWDATMESKVQKMNSHGTNQVHYKHVNFSDESWYRTSDRFESFGLWLLEGSRISSSLSVSFVRTLFYHGWFYVLFHRGRVRKNFWPVLAIHSSVQRYRVRSTSSPASNSALKLKCHLRRSGVLVGTKVGGGCPPTPVVSDLDVLLVSSSSSV